MPKDVQIDVHFATIAAMSKMGSQAAVEQAMTSEGWSTDTSLTRKNDKKWIQFLELLFVQIVPQQARSQVVPQWHQTAYRFQRIRCTKCFTSPENQKERKTTPESRVPAWSIVM